MHLITFLAFVYPLIPRPQESSQNPNSYFSMEAEPQSLDHESPTQSPLKRKSDLFPAVDGEDERTTKQQKADAPLEVLGASQDDKNVGANQNGNADKEKGRPILSAADKGKGKMMAEEEGSDDEGGQDFGDSSDGVDGSSEVDGDGDDNDSDFSDDPLAEMDLDNILPVRTRRRSALEPGAYLVEDKDDDDDDDDGDDDGDDDDDDDDDVEEEDEEEEEEENGEEVEEDKQEENK